MFYAQIQWVSLFRPKPHDRAWAIEAERRIDNFDAGETTAISLEESRARINRR
jgi:putative addiction module component (TIGR02574 family)